MNYILVFLLSFLATAKMAFQSAFSKKNVKNSIDALYFNIVVFITSALLFLPWAFNCSNAVWLYAFGGAVFTIGFQCFYTKALSMGNVALTVLTVNFNMVITVLVSYIFFDEPISFIRLIAICMMVAAFVICNGEKKASNTEKNWLVFAVLALIFSACAGSIQKAFGESPYNNENQAYISCMYLIASVIGILLCQVLKRREKRSFKIGFGMIKYGMAVGITLGVYQFIFNYSLANIDGTFLFPAQTGGTIIFSTLAGVVIFKDKFTKRQIIGALMGLVALVMMNY